MNFLRGEAEYQEGNHYTTGLVILEIPFSTFLEVPDGHKRVCRSGAGNIQVRPAQQDVSVYLNLYKDQGLNVHGDRVEDYSRRGWYEEACTWFTDKLLEERNAVVSTIVKISATSSGCVLRSEITSGEKFYMKAIGKGMHNEVCVASVLSAFMPKRFRKLVAVNTTRMWMIMEDYGKSLTKMTNAVYNAHRRSPALSLGEGTKRVV